MNEILSVVLGGMHDDMARMTRVGMNLANAQTAGYKREVASAGAFAAQVDALGAARASAASAGGDLLVHADLRPGTLKTTGQNLDLAILGPAWFEVSTPQGTAYTRQGDFRLDARGRLVTQQGHPVMGIGGEIQLPHGSPVVDAAGRVHEGLVLTGNSGRPGAPPLAQLKLVQFDPKAPMQRLGDGLVLFQAEGTVAAEGGAEVRQGVLENSNVSHLKEMVRLVETLRHMESLQKVATGYDEMLATSVRKLGEPA